MKAHSYKVLLLFIITTSVLFVFSCGDRRKHLKSDDIVGCYVFHKFQQDLSYDSLVLFSDSSYRQMFLSSTGTVYRNNGTWSLRDLSGELIFQNFKFFVDKGFEPGSGNWICQVVKSGDEIRIIYSFEEYYRQVTCAE